MTDLIDKIADAMAELEQDCTKLDARVDSLITKRKARRDVEYNKEAVNKEIAKDKRIKPGEAKTIHRLLQGRTASAPKPVVKKDAAYERDLKDNEPRYVIGVSGMKSKDFRKKFPNKVAMDRWFNSEAAGNVTVHYIEKAEF